MWSVLAPTSTFTAASNARRRRSTGSLAPSRLSRGLRRHARPHCGSHVRQVPAQSERSTTAVRDALRRERRVQHPDCHGVAHRFAAHRPPTLGSVNAAAARFDGALGPDDFDGVGVGTHFADDESRSGLAFDRGQHRHLLARRLLEHKRNRRRRDSGRFPDRKAHESDRASRETGVGRVGRPGGRGRPQRRPGGDKRLSALDLRARAHPPSMAASL